MGIELMGQRGEVNRIRRIRNNNDNEVVVIREELRVPVYSVSVDEIGRIKDGIDIEKEECWEDIEGPIVMINVFEN